MRPQKPLGQFVCTEENSSCNQIIIKQWFNQTSANISSGPHQGRIKPPKAARCLYALDVCNVIVLVGLKACSMQQFEQIGGVNWFNQLQSIYGSIVCKSMMQWILSTIKYLREQIQLLQDLCQHRSYEIPQKLRSLGCSGAESLWCRGGTEPHQQSVQQCPLPAILEGVRLLLKRGEGYRLLILPAVERWS